MRLRLPQSLSLGLNYRTRWRPVKYLLRAGERLRILSAHYQAGHQSQGILNCKDAAIYCVSQSEYRRRSSNCQCWCHCQCHCQCWCWCCPSKHQPLQQGNRRVIGKDAANAGSRIRPSSKRGPRPERTGAEATKWPAGQKRTRDSPGFYGWLAKANGEWSLCRTSSNPLKLVAAFTAMA
jgi:hypothetical protein